MSKIIELKNVNKWFDKFQALKDINLEVNQQEKIVICGPAGSGKSTLIRCINRLEEHQDGQIIVDGKDLTASFSGSRKGASINFSAADPLISGGLTQDEILDVIKSFQTQLRSCYQKQLQKEAEAGGTIQVKFII